MKEPRPVVKKGMDEEEVKNYLSSFQESMALPGGITKGIIKDYTGLVICMSCTIYFKWGWQEEKQNAICDAVEKYIKLFGDQLTWVIAEDEPGKPLHQDYKKTRPLRKLYKKWGNDIMVYRHYKGGEKIQDASPYSFL